MFLQYRANKQRSPQVVSVAQPDVSVASNSFTCVSRSSPLGSWVIDSGASDHITSNKSLLSDIVYSQSLLAITLADGIQTKPKGVGKAKPISSVTLDFVLYVPGSPFNLASVSRLTKDLHCSITFFDDFFLMRTVVRDRQLEQDINHKAYTILPLLIP